jgi:hypothetical protein
VASARFLTVTWGGVKVCFLGFVTFHVVWNFLQNDLKNTALSRYGDNNIFKSKWRDEQYPDWLAHTVSHAGGVRSHVPQEKFRSDYR